MQLIGMMDSPYVRRTFISARLLGVELEHRPLSVFRHFAEFHGINPAVRAPTLLLDDGRVLVDSTLIIDYLESLDPTAALTPKDPSARLECLRMTGIALSLCDKAVQLYYEIGLRPEPLRWGEWITRLTGQLRDTAALLDRDCACPQGWLLGSTLSQADVTAAVAWRFANHVLPHLLDAGATPGLAGLGERAERLAEFRAADFH